LHTFDSVTYTASVRLAGSIATLLGDVAVARNIDAADLTEGRFVALLQFDEHNPNDMVVCAVWEA
jgi:hypothetical protein